jgi:hypothetical protein
MGVTLWINTGKEETIEFGPTFPAYEAFAALAEVAGGWSEFVAECPDLSGLMSACESQEDAPPEWLADARTQARRFLIGHSNLPADAATMLRSLADPPEPSMGKRDS